MNKVIKYSSHFINKNDIKEVNKVLKSDYLTTGPTTLKFENLIKKKIKCKYTISCSSGTTAIYIALRSISLKKNDNIIIPANNFIAATNSAKILGANIYLADVDPFTGQMRPEDLINCIKINKLKKIKAFIAMYNGGLPLDVKKFFILKKKYKCFYIEDACHALGAKYSKKNNYIVGDCRYSDICIFSLHPLKTITTGEGGLITTNSNILYKQFLLLRNHGIIRNTTTKKKYIWKYDITAPSLNFRLNDISCALGISQLKKIENFLKKRNNIYNYYKKKLQRYSKYIYLPTDKKDLLSGFHLFIIHLNTKKISISRNQFIQKLFKRGILTQVHYVPTYKFSFYKYLRKTNFKGCEAYFKSSISIPIHQKMSLNDVNFVINSIKNLIDKYKK